MVGALFFTVLMVSGFSVLSLALDAQTDIVTTQRMVSDVELKKQQENFGIIVSTNATNHLQIGVTNLGQNPVGISSFWIINKTLANEPATRYEINYDDSFVSGASSTQILASQSISMVPDTYDIKVVSVLGTIEVAELDVSAGGSSSNSLQSTLLTNPPDVILGQNVTLAMVVTNVGQLTVEDVTPSTPSITPSASIVVPLPSDPSSVDLIPGESTVFVWDYQTDVNAGIDTEIDFSNFATGLDVNNNLVQSNVSSDTSVLREDVAGTEELIVLTQDLLARPAIFATIPGPFGDDSNLALWGINIVNPTAQSLEVSKIVVTTHITRVAGAGDVIIDADSCGATNVPITPSGTWTCPENNQVMWKNIASPAVIPGYSSAPFFVQIRAGTTNSESLESIPVSISAFTTLGQFGKSGYSTSMDDLNNDVMANVYLTSDPASATSPTNFLANVTGIPSGSVVKLNATLADFDVGTLRYIDQNSRLVINIPKGWTNPSVISASGFVIDNPIQTYADGSSQIVGTLTSDLFGNAGAQTIEFQVTAPDVTSTQLYVMYILADGTTSGAVNNALGPVSEVILQVIPP